MADRLTLTRALEEAGMPSANADRITTEIYDAIHNNVATKTDLEQTEAALRADLQRVEASLKADTARVEASLKADIARVEAGSKADLERTEAGLRADLQRLEASMQTQFAQVDTRFERLEHQITRMTIRLGVLVVAAAGLFGTVLHYWR
jgi:septation ring formation regulator EzrA